MHKIYDFVRAEVECRDIIEDYHDTKLPRFIFFALFC